MVRLETASLAAIVDMQKKTMASSVAKLNALKRNATKRNKKYVPAGRAWHYTNCVSSAAAGKSFGGCFICSNTSTWRCVRYEKNNAACMDIPAALFPFANNLFESKIEDWERHL